MTTTPRYCRPLEAGLASETSAVCRRLGRFLDGLFDDINEFVVEGAINEDIRAFRLAVLTKLEAEGWTASYDGGDRMKVRPPGHKRPFKRRVFNEEVST